MTVCAILPSDPLNPFSRPQSPCGKLHNQSPRLGHPLSRNEEGSMKQLHQSNFYGWSQFNEDRNIDFHSFIWCRPEGNVVIDPLPLTEHDRKHLESLGPVKAIIITNSDHIRDAEALAKQTGAEIWGPAGEKENFAISCQRWLEDGDEPIEGLTVMTVDGSKTPGELALLIDHVTLICGDLIRCHRAGRLCLLPDAKLSDKAQAVQSVEKIKNIATIDAVLTGDGWPIFQHGQQALFELYDDITEAW